MIYVFVLFMAILSGCNTMKGVGQDVEKTGEALKNSAEENKNY